MAGRWHTAIVRGVLVGLGRGWRVAASRCSIREYDGHETCTCNRGNADRVASVDPDERAFTFVDEHQCIGCYNCAMIARNTFLIEDTHGRARVFQQK